MGTIANHYETGVARPAYNQALEEDNHRLRFPQSASIFAKMVREDSQVRSVISAITLPIVRASWWLDPNGADPEVVQHVASDLRLDVLGENKTINQQRLSTGISWTAHLQQALRALQFGHMFFEQVYRVGDDGKEHLHKLAPRWPGTITKINVDTDGGLRSVVQSGTGISGKREIPVSSLVAYAYEDMGGSWIGESVLRPAYKHWQTRDRLMRLEYDILERNGMGVPIYTGSEFADNKDKDLQFGNEMAQGLRSGSASGGSIPFGSKLNILGVDGQLVSPREAIRYHESMIAKTVLAHFLNLESKGGSYALADVQSSFFVQSLQTTADWISTVANQHVVEDLVDVAYPGYEGNIPKIICDPIASKKELSATDLATLKREGLIFGDSVLEEHLRRVYNMPAKQPLDEALDAKSKRLEMEKEKGVTLRDESTEPETDTPIPGTDADIQRRQDLTQNTELVTALMLLDRLRQDYRKEKE